MSQDNVELVRRSFDAWNVGDLSRWISMHHPEVEPPGSREEWLAQARRLLDSWAEQRVEPKQIVDMGERVVVLFEWVTRGQGSHIDLITEMALIATVRAGLITHAAYYTDHAEALQAVGLSE
jgi:ketosteroid isomerase-like protein